MLTGIIGIIEPSNGTSLKGRWSGRSKNGDIQEQSLAGFYEKSIDLQGKILIMISANIFKKLEYKTFRNQLETANILPSSEYCEQTEKVVMGRKESEDGFPEKSLVPS